MADPAPAAGPSHDDDDVAAWAARASRSERARPGRLSRSADFERAYRRGRSVANRHFALYVFPRAANDAPRLGVSVGRRVGGAVVRNRVKRLLREAFHGRASALAPGHDYVAVARGAAAGLAEREGLAGVEHALDELLGQVGPSDEGDEEART